MMVIEVNFDMLMNFNFYSSSYNLSLVFMKLDDIAYR